MHEIINTISIDRPQDGVIAIERVKLEQVEQALTILAAIVARIAQDARAAKLVRRSELEATGQLRELVRGLEQRLEMVEGTEPGGGSGAPAAVDLHEILSSIEASLTSLARRKVGTTERRIVSH